MIFDEVYLIDGSAYIYRAFHAITPLNNANGLPTHAVFGFISTLRRILREKKPACMAIAFDTKGPVFRHRIYEDYKANRPPMPEDLAVQIPYIRKVVDAYNIVSLEDSDQEADDLIASAATRLSKQGIRVVIVTGDKDLSQLVSDTVTVWDPMKDRVIDPVGVKEKYGVETEQLLDYFSLTGDSSDNIPGVRGVGPKTAQKLIAASGSLEAIYNSLELMKPSKMKDRLMENRENAFLSRDLIRLNETVAVPELPEDYQIGETNFELLRQLFTELEFFTLLKSDIPARKIDTSSFTLINDEKAFSEVEKIITAAPHLVIDTETTSLDIFQAKLVGISLCVDKDAAFYIPCGHRDDDGILLPGQLPLTMIIEKLRPFLESVSLPKIGHNLKYDWSVLSCSCNGSVEMKGPMYDTMIGSWLLDPGRRTYKLDDLCLEMDMQLTTFSEIVSGDKSDDAFSRIDPEKARDYSCEDVYGSLCLFEKQKPLLEEKKLWNLFTEVECPLIPVLARMELTGIEIDSVLVGDLSQEFAEKLSILEKEIYAASGEEFNINSPKQLCEILFEKLNLPKGRKTKTGYSTDVKVLERLKQHHEVPALILEYRNIAKLKSTYTDNLSRLRNPETNRIHTSYNQCGTATGRLSSSNPNLQNIPIRTPEGRRIRSAFISSFGHLLLAGDYSQIDLRVLAHYSKDPALLDAFNANVDVHRLTASEIFHVSPALITNEMRRIAKSINFGIVYGMSSFGLASQLNLSRKEAQRFIDRYFLCYSGVSNFMESVVEEARENGYVSTLLGRRRALPDLKSSNRNRREFAERVAINTPIQGTAADIIKLAMLSVDQKLKEKSLKSRVILQIHDELVLEIAQEEEKICSELVQNSMQNVVAIDVPLVVNLEISNNLDKG